MDYAIFASYGNDSVALIQWMHEHGYGNAYVVYSETGWAHPSWIERVERGETLARSYGMRPVRISSIGFVELARLRKGFPRNGMQFCTTHLKIQPAQEWLTQVDPEGDLTCCVGVRREESRARQAWPEYTQESEKHGGRELWAPLVRTLEGERNALLRRAGFEPYEGRSRECWPCVNSNRADLRTLTPERVEEIARIEESMGVTSKGEKRTLFRPYRHGGAVGIHEVKKWADADRGKYEPPSGGCDSGFCGL